MLRKALIGIWNTYARTFKPRFSVERRMGLDLLLDRWSNLDRALLVRGSWERRQSEALLDLARRRREPGRRALFLDIGAHGGLYAIVAHRSRLFDEIVAFEPDPVNCAQMQANLFLNGAVEAVRVVQAAVSEAPGRLAFGRAETLRRGESRLEAASAGDAAVVGRFEVEAVRVDDAVPVRDALVAIKIDIEGHEVAALRGMARLLRENDCVLQVESFPEQTPALVAFLEGQGYRRALSIVHDHFFERA